MLHIMILMIIPIMTPILTILNMTPIPILQRFIQITMKCLLSILCIMMTTRLPIMLMNLIISPMMISMTTPPILQKVIQTTMKFILTILHITMIL